MSLGLLFWILMLLWLVLGVYWNWPGQSPPNYPVLGGGLMLFILLLLLGWAEFGPPIRG